VVSFGTLTLEDLAFVSWSNSSFPKFSNGKRENDNAFG
jgi:hypothetical protein